MQLLLQITDKYGLRINLNIMRRVFLAINLPDDLRKRLINWQKMHQNLSVHWTKPGSLHITLVFIGHVTDDEVYRISQLVGEAVKKQEPFSVKIKKIVPGPSDKTARMIWLEGEPSQEVANLKESIETALMEKDWGGSFRKENRPLRPHVTLARFHPQRFLSPARFSLSEEKFDCVFSVNSVELMESSLKHDGAEYNMLESFELGG